MTDKQLQLLGVAALVTFLIAGFLYSGISFSGDGFVAGTALIQGLDTGKIKTISISKDGKSVTLEKIGESFVLKEMNNYPAAIEKINQMLITCLDIRLREKVTKSESFHKDYGLAEDSSEATTVSFLDEAGEKLSGLIIGKNLDRGSGTYIRKEGDNTVYSTSSPLSIKSGSTDYLETKIFEIDPAKIQVVEVSGKAGRYSISRDSDELALSSIPKGREADQDELKEVFEILANLNFEDVQPAATAQAAWDSGFMCTLESGISYIVRTSEDGENILLSAQANPPAVNQISIDRDESDEELKKKEAILLDVDKAKEFNSSNAAWIYKIGYANGESLRKAFNDLLAEIEE